MNKPRSQQPGSRKEISRASIYGYIILVSILAFELFSYSSSERTLYTWFGDLGEPVSWARLLAFAFCVADIAIAPVIGKQGGLILLLKKLFTGELEYGEGGFIMLIVAWIITAFGDTFLTVVSIAESAASRPTPILVTAGIISMNTWLINIPIFIGCVCWLVQYLLTEKGGHLATGMITKGRA